jgi:hypothetical protein
MGGGGWIKGCGGGIVCQSDGYSDSQGRRRFKLSVGKVGDGEWREIICRGLARGAGDEMMGRQCVVGVGTVVGTAGTVVLLARPARLL